MPGSVTAAPPAGFGPRVLRRLLVAGVAAAVVALGILGVGLDLRVRAYLRGPAVGGIRIYGAPDADGRPVLLAVGRSDGATALQSDAGALPPACRDAVLAAEDRHFFTHPGLDPVAIGRALLVNLRAGDTLQGGSTLTQQLVKNAFLSPRRSMGRKIQEAALAVLLEVHATKAEILHRYLASVYLGSEGGVPVHGLSQGALVHLGRPADALDVADCALLAGMIRSPNPLSPRRHPDAARARRDEVLGLMAEAGLLDATALAAARAQPLRPGDRPRPVGTLYVADEVLRHVRTLVPADALRASGLVVQTTIDPRMQRTAEEIVRRRLDGVDPGRRRRLEAALVALDPGTGAVRALVGGRDYRSSRLDRAVRARRQPGSTFKPFVLLAALDPTRTAPPRTLASLVDDAPVRVPVAEGIWQPANHRGDYRGRVMLEDVLAHSLNAGTVRVALDVGIAPAIAAARDLGITAPLPEVPSMALGSGEVSLLELTAAYGTLARGGVRREPVLVASVTGPDGAVLYAADAPARRVVDPAVAYLVTHALEGVVARGTGRPARAAGLEGPAAGKTGTTDQGRDAWFVGWTPDVVAGVWVGIDRGGRSALTGASAALPVWTDFVRSVATPGGPAAFPEPPGLVWRDVDPTTGLLATPACPGRRRVPFLTGTEPLGTCPHAAPAWEAMEDGAREAGRAVGALGRRVTGWIADLFD